MVPLILQEAMVHSSVPMSGTASEVVGIFSATRLRNTVRDSNIVTPAKMVKTSS